MKFTAFLEFGRVLGTKILRFVHINGVSSL